MNLNVMMFAAMGFWRRRGAGDESASSVLRRVQATGAGAEGDVCLVRVADPRIFSSPPGSNPPVSQELSA